MSTVYLPAPDERVHIGVLRIVLRIPGSRSLKDRRRAVSALVDRVAARHHLWLAEVGHLENHQAAVLATSCVGNDPRLLQARLDLVRGEADQLADALLVEAQAEVFPYRRQE